MSGCSISATALDSFSVAKANGRDGASVRGCRKSSMPLADTVDVVVRFQPSFS